MTKPCLSILLISLAAASPAPAVPAQETAPKDKMIELFGDPVIAKGKGLEIKRSQLDTAMISLRAAAAGRNQPLPPDADRLILRNLINSQVLLSKATEADRTRGKELLQEALQRMRASGARGMLVVDDCGRLAWILARYDIFDHLTQRAPHLVPSTLRDLRRVEASRS